MQKKRLVIGISGASGAPLAIHLLQALRELPEWETHLVISSSGALTIREESGLIVHEVEQLADVTYDIRSIGAAIASGSFETQGMIVIPCSMKTAAGICSGYADNLLLRAADVTLKERRKLVLIAREAPFSGIHLRNLQDLSQAGAIILPPMMTFYNQPSSIEDMVHHIVCKALGVWNIAIPGYRRWAGASAEDADRGEVLRSCD